MPRFDGTGPAGMGPMTGGGRGWSNPYSPPYAGAGFTPYSPYGYPPSYFRPYGGYPSAYGFGRSRWGLRGFWGRGLGLGRGGRGMGRRWW
jgi:hypothetical protein